MLSTCEIRWFEEGKANGAIQEWLSHAWGRDLERADPRTDAYLRDKSTDTIGVKVREDKLEIKRRVSAQILDLEKTGPCPIASYRKWSVPLAGREIDTDTGDWIEVAKQRHLACWTGAGTHFEPAPLDTEKSPRCVVEYSELEIEEVDAWTLGLEVSDGNFDPLHELGDWLSALVEDLLNQKGAPDLTTQTVGDYPLWLKRYL